MFREPSEEDIVHSTQKPTIDPAVRVAYSSLMTAFGGVLEVVPVKLIDPLDQSTQTIRLCSIIRPTFLRNVTFLIF